MVSLQRRNEQWMANVKREKGKGSGNLKTGMGVGQRQAVGDAQALTTRVWSRIEVACADCPKQQIIV